MCKLLNDFLARHEIGQYQIGPLGCCTWIDCNQWGKECWEKKNWKKELIWGRKTLEILEKDGYAMLLSFH
jgi:hypothetical protein